MGGTSWSESNYSAYTSQRKASGTRNFDYSSKVSSGAVPTQAHETLDPKLMKDGKREARDSDAHPNSCPVYVGLDVTASMRSAPRQVQSKLPTLMGLLTTKAYMEDPAICVSAIGDAWCDSVPFQVGQFESGVEIDQDINNIFMEGGGGGNRVESYELAMYFLARCVASDAWEKRSKKGYAFIICDEGIAECLKRVDVRRVFGDAHAMEADIPIESLLAEVLERWEFYVIIPSGTYHARDASYSKRWRELLGERVLSLDDAAGASELIASVIGVLEGSVNLNAISSDLQAAGVDSKTIDNVTRAVSTVVQKRDLSSLAGGDTGLAKL